MLGGIYSLSAFNYEKLRKISQCAATPTLVAVVAALSLLAAPVKQKRKMIDAPVLALHLLSMYTNPCPNDLPAARYTYHFNIELHSRRRKVERLR